MCNGFKGCTAYRATPRVTGTPGDVGRETVRLYIMTCSSIRNATEAKSADIERVAKNSGYVSGMRQQVDCVNEANRADEGCGVVPNEYVVKLM